MIQRLNYLCFELANHMYIRTEKIKSAYDTKFYCRFFRSYSPRLQGKHKKLHIKSGCGDWSCLLVDNLTQSCKEEFFGNILFLTIEPQGLKMNGKY